VERSLRLIVLPAAITMILAIVVLKMMQTQDGNRPFVSPVMPDCSLEVGALICLGSAWTYLVIAWFRRYRRMQRWQWCVCGYNLMGLDRRVCPECGRGW
jgi:hypothetical protein